MDNTHHTHRTDRTLCDPATSGRRVGRRTLPSIWLAGLAVSLALTTAACGSAPDAIAQGPNDGMVTNVDQGNTDSSNATSAVDATSVDTTSVPAIDDSAGTEPNDTLPVDSEPSDDLIEGVTNRACRGDLTTTNVTQVDPKSRLTKFVDDSYNGDVGRAIGQSGDDVFFIHTFTLTGYVTGAWLEMDVVNGHHNDAAIVTSRYAQDPYWAVSLSSLSPVGGPQITINLDLDHVKLSNPGGQPAAAKSLIAAMNSRGELDVVVQDDSTVNRLVLYTCTVPITPENCPAELVDIPATEINMRPELVDYITNEVGYTGQVGRKIDEGGDNKFFLHTFDFAGRVLGAWFTATIDSGGSNDAIQVGAHIPSSPYWYDKLADIGIPPGNTVDRDLNNVDLKGMSLLQSMTDNQTLDVIVQDDSTVTSLNLRLCLRPLDER